MRALTRRHAISGISVTLDAVIPRVRTPRARPGYPLTLLLLTVVLVDRNSAHAVSYLELRRRLRRDVGREVPGVDDPAPVGHFEALAGLS